MKKINKEGPEILNGFHMPGKLDASTLPALLAKQALVIDTRPADEYAKGHLAGTINIPLNGSFVTWAGWLIRQSEFYLIVDAATAAARLGELSRSLALIGIDRITGYFDAADAHGDRTVARLSVNDLAARLDDVTVIDVRNATEWKGGHIPGAIHIPLGHLTDRAGDIPPGRPIVVQCQSGGRSSIAASLLEQRGFADVINLTGGLSAWAAAGLPIEKEAHEAQTSRA